MSRGLSTANSNAAIASVVRPVVLVKLAFESGTVYANTSVRSVVYDGNTYVGVGNFGGIDKVEEDIALGANGLNVVLSGVDGNLVSIALQEKYQGRQATIYYGFLDSNHTLVDTPVVIFSGMMDTMVLQVGQQSTISMSCENRLSRWDKAANLRYNDATQRIFYPLDKGFEFVEQAAEKEIFWGRQPNVSSTGSGGGA